MFLNSIVRPSVCLAFMGASAVTVTAADPAGAYVINKSKAPWTLKLHEAYEVWTKRPVALSVTVRPDVNLKAELTMAEGHNTFTIQPGDAVTIQFKQWPQVRHPFLASIELLDGKDGIAASLAYSLYRHIDGTFSAKAFLVSDDTSVINVEDDKSTTVVILKDRLAP